MSKELLSSIMAEIKINFLYSYFDFALFKISPKLRQAHIRHGEEWNSAIQGYLK